MLVNSAGCLLACLFIVRIQGAELNRRSGLLPEGKSVGEYARQKIADLHVMKRRFEKYRSDQSSLTPTVKQSYPTTLPVNLSDLSSLRANKGQWSLVLSLLSGRSQGRSGFWSKFLPSPDILMRLSKMRDNLEPHVKSYLTTKYNDFLTNLIPYSDNIGVPPFVLNSMKIPENFDPRWNYINKLLETSTLDNFFQTLPDIKSLQETREKSKKSGRGARMLDSRSDDDFISDQEPQATSKGKKKYRLPNRLQAYRKGELEGGNSERASYGSYGSYGDQFSQSSNAYDAYSRAYDDYYSGGGKGGMDKGNSYDGYFHKAGNTGKYLNTGFSDSAFAAGHSSHSTSKGHSQAHGGSYGSTLSGYLDPFSILGGLAFLVYLGLLFQQSLSTTTAPGGRGRTADEDLIYHSDFGGIPFPPKYNNREDRSLDSNGRSLNQLGEIEHGIKALLTVPSRDCPLLQYCKILKQIRGIHFFDPLRPLLEKEILEKDPHAKTALQKMLRRMRYTRSDCSSYTCSA